MKYFLAIFCPPLALIIEGKIFHAIFNIALCFLLWFPAVIHAFCIVHSEQKERDFERMRELMRSPR
jgi:uncharacterized membrane protein YqaE (UPF0057 family)